MLLQVRADRLRVQAEEDLVFVAATTIQNVYVHFHIQSRATNWVEYTVSSFVVDPLLHAVTRYRQRDARRRLKFVRTVRAALRAKEEAEKEERARAKAEELRKAAALRDEVDALKELE